MLLRSNRLLKRCPTDGGEKAWECNSILRALPLFGIELKDMPNSKSVYEEYLKRNGWTKMPMPKDNGKRIKLEVWADTLHDKLFIANIVRHLTVVENGTLLDTWNCGHKCIGNYYIKS